MKRKVILTLLVSSFMLVAVVIAPLHFQDKGTTYQPTHHGEI
ncbi:UNVERIFIED_CONTAM: hypothetical protein ABIC26_003039 [Paenibacillus sp. PvR008]